MGSVRKRSGCSECRRKKVKCDETRPVCSRCLKFPRLCRYNLNVMQADFSGSLTEAPAASSGHEQLGGQDAALEVGPSRDIVSSARNRQIIRRASPFTKEPLGSGLCTRQPTSFPMLQSDAQRFYFHHFTTHTAGIYFPLQPDTFLGLVIPISEQSPCMLQALIAASCSHFFRLRGSEDSQIAAITATMRSLSSLRGAIATTQTKNENVGLLLTSLVLATTSLCGEHTAVFRKHVGGALNIVLRDDAQNCSDPLWLFSIRWLIHLLLMDKLSGSLLLAEQRHASSNWRQLLTYMPDSGEIDTITGLSRELVNIIDQVCDLSMATRATLGLWDENPDIYNGGDGHEEMLSISEVGDCAHSLEIRLFELQCGTKAPLHNTVISKELENSHQTFLCATLLYLYRYIIGLAKNHPKVKAAVASTVAALENIEKHSLVNIPLLWPLLMAGCEATTDTQRQFISGRLTATSLHGLGNCIKSLQFMREYWAKGDNVRWDVFARQIGTDLVMY